MRKFSKIFATLLTLAIIVGTIVVMSGALVPKATTDFGKSDNFETTAVGKNAKGFGSGTGSADTYSTKVIVKNEETNNQYLRYSFLKAGAPKAYRRDYEYAPYSSTAPTTHIADYSYFTVDFDVCADAYAYEIDGVTYMSREIPELAENVRLAYSPGTYFSIDNRLFNGESYPAGYSVITVTFRYEDNAWKLFIGGKDTGYTLSDKLDAWNHFTYAVKVIAKEVEVKGETKITYGYSEVRFYLDGIFVSSSDISASNKATAYDINPRAIDWYISDLSTPYSMGIDNFAPTFYYAGYSSGKAYGIDDLFDEDKSAPLMFCEDVVYDRNYVVPGNPYISLDTGATKTYMKYFLGDVLSTLKTGDMIETGFDIIDFTPDESVESFEVYLINNATFSLSEKALEKYDIVKSALGYKVTKKSAPEGLKLNLLDSKGGTAIASVMLYAGNDPVIDLNVVSQINLKTGLIDKYTVGEWRWDIDGESGDTEYDYKDELVRALSDIEMEIAKQYWNGSIDVYPADLTPIEEDVKAKLDYIVLVNGSSVWYNEGESLEVYYDINTLESRFASIPANAKIVLYEDAVINSSLKIKENAKIEIDLNGYSIDSDAASLFVVSNNSEIIVYSADEAVIKIDNGDLFTTVGGSSNFNNAKIVFGDAEKGNKVIAKAANFLNATTANAMANDNKPISVSINAYLVWGNFVIAAPDVEIEINDSLVYSEGVIFETLLDYEQFFAIDAKISVNNSEIISESAIIGDLAANSVISISDATLCGSLESQKYDQKGSIVIGANVEFDRDVRKDNSIITLVDGVCYAVANYEIDCEGLTINVKLIAVDAGAVSSEDFAIAIWKDATGKNFKEEYYHKTNLTPIHPSAHEMKDEAKFPGVEDLGNGWYDRGYRTWKNADEEGKSDELIAGETTVFLPVADGVVPAVDFKLNLSLKSTAVAFNLYAQIPAEDSGIVVNAESVYYLDVDGNKVYTQLLTGFAGAEGYYAIEIPLELVDFTSKTVVIEFAVVGYEDEPIVLEEVIEIDFLTYAEIATELYACGSEDAKLVLEVLRYKKAAAEAAGAKLTSGVIAKAEAILAMHGESCKCISDLNETVYTDAELNASISANESINDKILGAEFDLGNDKVDLYFYVDASVNVESFAIKHKGLLDQLGGWDYINYKINVVPELIGYVNYNGVDCAVYAYNNISLYNASAIMNITLTVASASEEENAEPVIETFTGAYSLAAYIAEVGDEYIDFAAALYAASNAALEFRFIREGEYN